jgi:WD40 repeat protein
VKWPAAYDASCSDDGRRVACIGRNVVVIDIAARRRVSTSHPLSHPSHAAFSPDGDALAVKATSGRIVLLDPASGEVLHDHRNQEEGEGSEVRFAPDGEHLVDGSWGGALTVRHARDGAVLSRQHYPGEMITRVTHDLDRRTWLVEHRPTVRPGHNRPRPGYVSLRHWPFSPHPTRAFSFKTPIESATLSPDGSRFSFIQTSKDRRVRIARASDGKVLATSPPLDLGGTGSALAWSLDARHLVAVSDGVFVFYRAADLTVVERMPCEYPSSLAFIPGGDELLLGSWNTSRLVKLGDVVNKGA